MRTEGTDEQHTEEEEERRLRAEYYVVGSLLILLVWILGLIGLWRNLSEDKAEWMKLEGSYITQRMSGSGEADDAQQVLDRILAEKRFDALIGNESRYFYVYDRETGDLVGTGDEERVRNLMDLPASKILTSGNYQYEILTPDERYIVVLESGRATLRRDFERAMPAQVLILVLALLACLCAPLAEKHLHISHDRSLKFLSAAVFLLVAVMVIVSAIAEYRFELRYYRSLQTAVLENISADVREIGDTDVSEERKNELLSEYIEDYYVVIDEITYDGSIWDTAVPIRDRVSVTVYDRIIENTRLAYLLQGIMLAVLAVCLLRGLYYYHGYFLVQPEKSGTGVHASAHRHASTLHASLDLFKIILCLKSVADALTVTVTAELLKQYLSADFGISSGKLMSLAVLGASAVGLAGTLLVPGFVRITATKARLLPAVIAVCLAGNLLCFSAGGSAVFIAGYFCMALGDSVFGMMFFLLACEQESDQRKARQNMGTMLNGKCLGELAGYAAGGVLSAAFSYRTLFLMAAVMLACFLPLSLRVAAKAPAQPERVRAKLWECLKDRNFVFYLLFIQMPFAMIGYYFKYVVPLAVSEIQLTQTFVSFVFFIRMAVSLYFRTVDPFRDLRSRLGQAGSIRVFMLVAAVSLAGLAVVRSALPMVLMTLLLAVVQARYSGMLLFWGYDLVGQDPGRYYGLEASRTAAGKVGTSLAASVTNGLGLLALPVLIACAAAASLGIREKETEQ